MSSSQLQKVSQRAKLWSKMLSLKRISIYVKFVYRFYSLSSFSTKTNIKPNKERDINLKQHKSIIKLDKQLAFSFLR